MERKDSVVTPERFASGRTFDQYLAFIGTPDNLAREGSASGPRRDQTAAMRGWYEANPPHRCAGGGHPLARRSARRPRQDSGDLGGVVVGLPARRADAGARGRGGGDGAAHLHARRPALQRERAAEPGRGARQQCRSHGGVPERQERADLAVDPRRRLLHEGSRVPLPLHRVPGDLSQGPAGSGPHPRAAARGRQRRDAGARRPRVRRYSNRPSFASGRARPSTRSSARCTGVSSWARASARCPSSS